MSDTVFSIHSADGNLELALCPATIELRLSSKAAREFDEACEAQKETWLPVWRQVKFALISAAQFASHKVADKLRSIPLEAVTEVTCSEGRLQVITAGGNQIGGHMKMEVGTYKLEVQLDDPGLFAETDGAAFASRFSEVKPLFDAYLAQLRQDS